MIHPQFFLSPRMAVNVATPLACVVSTTHDSRPETTMQASILLPTHARSGLGQDGGEAPSLRWEKHRGEARRCPFIPLRSLKGGKWTVKLRLDRAPNGEPELCLRLALASGLPSKKMESLRGQMKLNTLISSTSSPGLAVRRLPMPGPGADRPLPKLP
jgi:hypothetical protein